MGPWHHRVICQGLTGTPGLIFFLGVGHLNLFEAWHSLEMMQFRGQRQQDRSSPWPSKLTRAKKIALGCQKASQKRELLKHDGFQSQLHKTKNWQESCVANGFHTEHVERCSHWLPRPNKATHDSAWALAFLFFAFVKDNNFRPFT